MELVFQVVSQNPLWSNGWIVAYLHGRSGLNPTCVKFFKHILQSF